MSWLHPDRGWRRVAVSGLLGTALCWPVTAQTSSSQTSSSAGDKPATTEGATKAATSTQSASSKSSSTKSSSTKTATTHKTSHKKSTHSKKGSKKRGQQAIDSSRAREIQTALIREHYMNGTPSGSWDAATQEAMRRYQADHGWQSKTIPDSRALIQLGLGPSQEHLLNPESAMTTTPGADPKSETKQQPAEGTVPQH
jgi:hypothetical protein